MTSSPFQDTTEIGSDVSRAPLNPRHEYPPRVSSCNIRRVLVFWSEAQDDDQLLSLPRLTNALIHNVKLGAYINTSFTETDEPLPTSSSNGFTQKGNKTLDELLSVFHILYLKKQRAEAKVDMFSEAIVLNAELEFTDDGRHAAFNRFYHANVMIIGMSSGKATMYEWRLHDNWFNDWFLTSSAPSDASDIL